MICGLRRCASSALVALLASVALGNSPTDSSVKAAVKRTAATQATGYAHIAHILATQCASCHNPQGGAPFNLLTYEDAKQWGGQILDVTQSRYMPPWLPAPDKGDFAGARRLSDADLAAIRSWVGAGMPAGSATTPAIAAKPAAEDWALGKPDAVLTLAEPVKLPGNGPDVFFNLIMPVTVAEPRTLRAIQIRPSDPQAVRSVWLGIDESGMLQKNDRWQQGIAGMEPPPGADSGTAGLVFWTAGSQAIEPSAPEQWLLRPGSDLVLTTHLKTTGRKQAVQIEVALYYASPSAGEGSALLLALNHKAAIDLPAGAANKQIEDSVTLPQAAAVTAIYPRAHFLARSLDAYATTPEGKQIALITIPKWDADWLEAYRYRKPVALPAGSVVRWKYVYDNSSENPHNPSDPPIDVHAGIGPKDEQAGLMLELVPPPGADAAEWRKSMMAAAAK